MDVTFIQVFLKVTQNLRNSYNEHYLKIASRKPVVLLTISGFEIHPYK